jgi:hypothetical protein
MRASLEGETDTVAVLLKSGADMDVKATVRALITLCHCSIFYKPFEYTLQQTQY